MQPKDLVMILLFVGLCFYTVVSINEIKVSSVKTAEVKRLCREYFLSGFNVGVATARSNPDISAENLKKGATQAIDIYLKKNAEKLEQTMVTPTPTREFSIN